MSRLPPLWLQAGDYAASTDRRLLGALYPLPRCDGCSVGIAGTGDMTVAIQPGCVSVPTSNGTGSTLCYSDGIEQVVLDAAPAAGNNRVDLIVCQPTGADIGGGADEFVFAKVTGVAAVPPAAIPATPPGTVLLAQITVIGGSVTVDPANIIDKRPSSLAVPDPAREEEAARRALWTASLDSNGGSYWSGAADQVVGFTYKRYDPSNLLTTGADAHFTAPDDGVYHYEAKVTGATPDLTVLRIYAGGTQGAGGYHNQATPQSNAHASVMSLEVNGDLRMVKGETARIYLRCRINNCGINMAYQITYWHMHYVGKAA